MPQGSIDYGEAKVTPQHFIVKNCGEHACNEFDKLCAILKTKGARFITCGELANEY